MVCIHRLNGGNKMVSVSLTREELQGIIRLVVENQNSGRLQNLTHLSYLDSIKLNNKLRKY